MQPCAARNQTDASATSARRIHNRKTTRWIYLKRFTTDIPGVEQRESDLMVIFPNGSRVRLYGADNFDRLRGTYR